MDIAEFVRARLDEDEAVAREAASRPLGAAWDDGTRLTAVARHLNRHDPARVLREVGAKRAILADHVPDPDGSCMTCVARNADHPFIIDLWLPVDYPCASVRQLAAAWDDHPDYDEAWRP